MTTAEHRYTLEKYAGRHTRHKCPRCKAQGKFTRYIDTDTGQYIAEHVGKCERINSCQYHMKPREYFAGNPRPDADSWRESNLHLTTYTSPPPPPPDYIPPHVMEASKKHYRQNNFMRFFSSLLGEEQAAHIAALYHIGTARHWRNDEGLACLFWQVDAAGNVRQGKAMGYNPHTGKRLKQPDGVEVWSDHRKGYRPARDDKEVMPRFIGKLILGKDANPVQCFFGEHLLPTRPDAVVCICESEKTACIMATVEPAHIWLATGGKNGARWTDESVYQVLAGRHVALYPDLGAYADWSEKAKLLRTVCAGVHVVNLADADDAPDDVPHGYDIADYYIPHLLCRSAADDLAEQPAAAPQEAHENVLPIAPHVEPQQEQEAPQRPEMAYTLPKGFEVVSFPNGNTVTYNGLPLEWLNETEHAEAMQILGVRGQLEVMTITRPAVSQFAETFGLEVET